MARAQKRDAVSQQKFFFRKGVFQRSSPPSARSSVPSSPTTSTLNGHAHDPSRPTTNGGRTTRPCSPEFGPVEDEYEEMTADEIVNGKGDYPGLVGVVSAYVDSLELDLQARCQLAIYLDLVRSRASGAFFLLQLLRDHLRF